MESSGGWNRATATGAEASCFGGAEASGGVERKEEANA
ncbi:hypothetical protein ACP70R_038058 [Stipagrostis hirtigluma subsp. patula]